MTPSISDSDLDVTFAALADPTRRAIIAQLARGEASVLELADPFDMSQPAISKHLKVLERAGLISRSRDAQRRPCRLEPARLKQLADWIGTYRDYWEESFNRLDDYLQELQGQELQGQELQGQELQGQELQGKQPPGKETPRDIKKTRSHRRTR